MESPKGLKEFIRNPLGIIALFITMIYGVANLLLGKSVDSLTSAERWPLILFVVVFPIVVLVAFYWLVKNHHKKLYAPADFRSDESFLSAMTTHDVIDRLREEVVDSVQEIEPENSASEAPEDVASQPVEPESSASEAPEDITSQPAEPEIAAPQVNATQEISPSGFSGAYVSRPVIGHSLGDRILELAQITDYIKYKYREFSLPTATSNALVGRSKIGFDAVNVSEHGLRALEVKYVREGGSFLAVLRNALNDAKIVKKEVSNFSLLLVVVYENAEKMRRAQQKFFDILQDYPYIEVVFVSRDSIPVTHSGPSHEASPS